MEFDLSAAVRDAVARGGDGDGIAFRQSWRSWRWLGDAMAAIDAAVAGAASVGLVARTRPQHVAAFAAGIAAHRTTLMIYPSQSPTGIAADISALRLPAVIADAEDWSEEALEAARNAGSLAVAIEDAGEGRAIARLLTEAGPGPFRDPTPDVAFELLSSGTTGAPKRVPLTWTTLASATADAKAVYAGSGAAAPQLVVQPLGNVTGIAYLLPPLTYGQSIVLLEKFEPNAWAEAVRTYKPIRTALPPAGVRMVLDAEIAKEDLASLTVIGVGGGKVDESVHARFEQVYGIPILHAFGATEFGGVVANWTLDA